MKNYLTDDYTLRSWFFTTDHKRIAILSFVRLAFRPNEAQDYGCPLVDFDTTTLECQPGCQL